MKQLSKIKRLVSGLTLSVAVVASSAASAFAAPAPAQPSATPPASAQVSGEQAKPPVEPGAKDAQKMEPLGPTAPQSAVKSAPSNLAAPMAGAVAGVDFQAHLKYCYKNLVYAPVKNTTAATKYLQVRVYNQSTYHDIYTSVAAGGTVYPAFYGIEGAYTAYLYVWNGSSYVYDEYLSGTNTCNVSVTRVYNSGGWVQLKIQNLGTAYATQVSTELAPYPGSGTYTGTQYDYPTPGGAALYRWFQVGTQPYGIASYTSGSFNTPYFFTGDL